MTENKVAVKGQMTILKDLLDKAKPSMLAILPKTITAERMIKLALLTVSRNQTLLRCTADSILKSVMTSAQLGLEIGGVLPEAHLVPFWNSKINGFEAQLIPDYRGLIKLAIESGAVESIEAHIIHEKDVFSVRYGSNPELVHGPALNGGEMIGVYAIARLASGGTQFEIMSKMQVDAIRGRSKSKDKEGNVFGTWVTDYEEMARKTVTKKLFKYLPRATEKVAEAISLDNKNSGIEIENSEDILDMPEITEPQRLSEAKVEVKTEVKEEAKTEEKKAGITTDEMIAKMKEAKAKVHLKNIINKYYPEFAKTATEADCEKVEEWRDKLEGELK